MSKETSPIIRAVFLIVIELSKPNKSNRYETYKTSYYHDVISVPHKRKRLIATDASIIMHQKIEPVIKKIHAMPKSSLQDTFKVVYLSASGHEKRRIKGILIPDKNTKWIIYCKKCKEFHYEKTRKSHRAILR